MTKPDRRQPKPSAPGKSARPASSSAPPAAMTARPQLRLSELGLAAAAVAHELRQPLSAIQNLAAHLKTKLAGADGNLETSTREALELLEEQAHVAGRLVEDLASFARHGRAVRRPCDLRLIVETVLHRIALPTTIRMEVNLRPPRAAAQGARNIVADPIHLESILTNLIQNAIDSMNGSGMLTIELRNVRGSAIVRVSDTGCGIDAADAERIFEAFYTTKRKGTGLGLALCRELAEANSGTIQVKSQLGVGTTFELRLPRAG